MSVQFQNIVDVIEYIGGSIGTDNGIVEHFMKEKKVDTSKMDEKEMEAFTKAVNTEAQGWYLAVRFISALDCTQYITMAWIVLNTLQWLRECECPWDSTTSSHAAYKGYLRYTGYHFYKNDYMFGRLALVYIMQKIVI
jgi:hypothetical protein